MKHAITVVATLLVCATSNATAQSASADGLHLRSNGIDVIAHRGASAYAPENTIAAFDLAIEMGADWFELDCTMSEDGEIVVIHDATVDRTTNGTGAVAALTFAELRELDAGSWKDEKYAGEKIPSLDESLATGKSRAGVYVEIKDSDNDAKLRAAILEEFGDPIGMDPAARARMTDMIRTSGSRNYALTRKAIATIRERGVGDQVVIQSFSPIVCAIAIHEAPEIRTEFLGEETPESPDQWDAVLRWLELLEPPGFNPNKRAMKLRLSSIEEIRDQGLTISVWTIDGRRDTLNYAEWGVNAIITNRPDNALQILSEAGHR